MCQGWCCSRDHLGKINALFFTSTSLTLLLYKHNCIEDEVGGCPAIHSVTPHGESSVAMHAGVRVSCSGAGILLSLGAPLAGSVSAEGGVPLCSHSDAVSRTDVVAGLGPYTNGNISNSNSYVYSF